MNKNIAIKVENLSKAYQLGQIGTGTISRDLERFWTTKIRGKEDPFLKIGQTNDRTVKGDSDIVWSLKDINFEIEQGEAIGIIGRNGAGKSTLLKLLSRVTAPTTGNIKVKGRIASLLEVGTGFHPELTGRENIYLNGAILGMRKKEITRKFDEIVDFSGVERYIDTPVKRYSSGMYVRLAFAVAAHLESEILIVDEVLAVGDAEFQKKCLGKMGDVSKGEGRTVLFVSHNMNSVSQLCNSGIVLKDGFCSSKLQINEIISNYMSNLKKKTIGFEHKDKPIFINYFNTEYNTLELNTEVNFIMDVGIFSNLKDNYPINIGIGIDDKFGNRITTLLNKSTNSRIIFKNGQNHVQCILINPPLKSDEYYIKIQIFDQHEIFDYIEDGIPIKITNNVNNNFSYGLSDSQGSVLMSQKWLLKHE